MTEDKEDCRALCVQHAECVGWVRMKSDGRCWIKTKMEGKNENENTISGKRNCIGKVINKL